MSDTSLTPHIDEAPAVFETETALLESTDVEAGVWVVFPGEEDHWNIEDWSELGADHNPVPWWIIAMWVIYFLWGAWYTLYGASQW